MRNSRKKWNGACTASGGTDPLLIFWVSLHRLQHSNKTRSPKVGLQKAGLNRCLLAYDSGDSMGDRDGEMEPEQLQDRILDMFLAADDDGNGL